MEEKRFTPGPWEWWTSNSFLRLSSKATGKDGGVIDSTVMRDGHSTLLVKREDMALISSAPELLEELQEMAKMLDAAGCEAATVNAHKIIAKALGKE
ncbi:hypothetical protein [Kluyvera georgiana]|uniref:hypothetical protein n=1 Tax=Kluyvera georgiana TaxID=73098 RepID=UPI00321F6DE3